MQFLITLDELLEHIKKVEGETIDLTKEAQLRMVRFIEKNKLPLDDETLEAMQYQDIISQQLSATIEAIENVQSHLQSLTKSLREDDTVAMEGIKQMHESFNSALERAKVKREAFGGKLQHGDDDGIEFF